MKRPAKPLLRIPTRRQTVDCPTELSVADLGGMPAINFQAARLKAVEHAVAVDITALRCGEEVLRVSEEWFRQIVDAAQEGVWTVDTEGVTTFVNCPMACLLGYEVQEMLGRPFSAFLDDEGRAQVAANAEHRRQGRPDRVDVKFLRQNGTTVWAQVSTSTMFDQDGREMGDLAMIADVTERRRAEADRSRLAAIVTSSENAIFAKTLDGIITDWNRGAERLYGYSSEEIVGQSASRLAPLDRKDEIRSLLERLGRGERIDHFATTRLRKDGSRVEVAMSLSPILDSAGRVTGAAVIAHDSTAESHAALARLELARDQAAHAEAERGRRRETFLAESSQRLASSLDYEATLRAVARLAVPEFADYCLIYVTENGADPRVVAVAHADSTKEPLLHDLQLHYAHHRDAPGGVAGVLRTGESVIYPEISDAEYRAAGHDGAHAACLRALGPRSAMTVPLAARGRTFGAMSFVQSISGRGFTRDDLSLAEDLARRCAQAIDNSLLYQEAQREIAERSKIEAERAQLLQQIEQERATLAEVLGSMSDGLLLLDSEGRAMYCNVPAGELLGLEPKLTVGQPTQAVFLQLRHLYGDLEVAWATWQAALATLDDRPRFDLSLPGPPVRDLQLRLFPVAGGPTSGGRIGILVQDVTAERELQRARDDLVSMVSHEIASPATNLVAYAELLASESTGHSMLERQEMLASMVTEGQRLNAIVRDFLVVQRLENQGMHIAPQPTDLRPLVEHAATSARTDPDHRLVVDLPERLPLVHIDPDRTQQVLANLLSNARKYTPAGGEIRLSACLVAGAVELSVTDDGLGIPAKALPHLFEKFYRVGGSERRNIKGTGLGLAIVKELIEAQGGRVGAESAGPGRGSRFWFSIPLARSGAEHAEGTPRGSTQADRPAPGTPTPVRVLVVDDDPTVGNTVKRVLRIDGHRVTVVTCAEDAIQQLAGDSFDVVVSDLGLGAGLNGLDLARQVQMSWPRVHFVLATGSVGIDQVAARADGVEAFLPKPYGPRDLRDLIAEVARSASTQKEAA